jgi:hypothetical protein
MARKKRKTQIEDSADENVVNRTTLETETELTESVQSGDLQGLSGDAAADSESVRELLEEGQAFEAGVVSGVENAPPADAGEIHLKELPEDDVPLEYIQRNRDEPRE